MLVTSRTPLHLSGEHEFPVPPLRLPDPAHLPDVDSLSQYESVALFVERARAVKADFAITNANAPAVAEICVRLDGLPLAIELAAARAKLLSPQALLARLEQRFDLLTGGPRDQPERQQTLRATIDWSFGLLGPDEQTLFAQLAVFAGGCTLEAAETVCGADGVLTTLSTLIDNNLLGQEEQPDGEPRFTMLETIHAYALELLGEGAEADALRRRHAEYFIALAERIGELERSSRTSTGPRSNASSTISAARSTWLGTAGENELAVQLVCALADLWDDRATCARRADGSSGRSLSTPPMPRRQLQARANLGAASLAWRQRRARPLAGTDREALELFRELGDQAARRLGAREPGDRRVARGDNRASRKPRRAEAEQIFRDLGHRARGDALQIHNRL